ncbi:hypothetical protein [Komagataeibacter europaeus]|uniref:hypothetical protein n=1 Tax=Komagataeibacter europaeus TaxID=33995 RepID=UPI00128F1B97|nr:hypothetical protein [Komagataeibacter europaeus]
MSGRIWQYPVDENNKSSSGCCLFSKRRRFAEILLKNIPGKLMRSATDQTGNAGMPPSLRSGLAECGKVYSPPVMP